MNDVNRPNRRTTRQGTLIREAVINRHDHPSANEIHKQLESTGIGLATVYRQLAALVEDGEIIAVEHEGEIRYDRNIDPHAHAACVECGHIWDVPIPQGIEEMAEVAALTSVRTVDLTIRGICRNCA